MPTKGKPDDTVKKDIPAEVQDAINKLPNCFTLDELTMLKETLDLAVKTHPEFKNAGMLQYNKILNATAKK